MAPPKKEPCDLKKKHMWNPDLAFFGEAFIYGPTWSWSKPYIIYVSTSEICRAKKKNSRKPWKSGVLLEFFRNNYANYVSCWSTFFGSWSLFFLSSFFGGFPTKWCLWLHDSIHDHRGFGTAVRDPMMFDEALKKLLQLRLHSAVFSVWGRRICMYLLSYSDAWNCVCIFFQHYKYLYIQYACEKVYHTFKVYINLQCVFSQHAIYAFVSLF